MDKQEILRHVDHTVLGKGCSWEDIKKCCDDARKYHTATICIPPVYIRRAKEYAPDVRVTAVLGFPAGYCPTAVKVYEVGLYLADGADEFDICLNVCDMKDGRYGAVLEELRAVKAACGEHPLKVIVETCLLSEEEKIAACRLVTEAGCDYIKTSTGFFGPGATFADIELFRANIGPDVKMKAAGGVKTFEDAEKYLALGCDRIGTSGLVKLMNSEAAGEY